MGKVHSISSEKKTGGRKSKYEFTDEERFLAHQVDELEHAEELALILARAIESMTSVAPSEREFDALCAQAKRLAHQLGVVSKTTTEQLRQSLENATDC